MRGWTTTVRAGAVAMAVVGIGTPVLATLVMPVVFPLAVAAGVAFAWRRGRGPAAGRAAGL